MRPLCILYLHHANDDVTRYHYQMIKRSNPSTAIVPLTFNRGLTNAVKLPVLLPAGQRKCEWRNVDKLIYEWYMSGSRIEAERYLILESDTLCNIPIKEFYFNVWDRPASGAIIQTPSNNPQYRPFMEVRNSQVASFALQAITPLCGIMLSHEAMVAASTMAQDPIFNEVYCELRIGTLLSGAGYIAEPISKEIVQYISCFERAPTGPGVWHKVKTKFPTSIRSANGVNVKESSPFQQISLPVEVQMKRLRFNGFKFKKQGRLVVEQYNGYETRNESTIRMINLAMQNHDLPNFDWTYVYSGNKEAPKTLEGARVLCYATASGSYENVCPDYTFDHWSQTRMDDYEQTRAEISQAGDAPPETNLLGWRGNIKSHANRQRIVALDDKKDFDTESIEWNRTDPHRLTCDNFVSLADQAKKWRYLIDVESVGWSARLKLLLFSKRVVFIQDRPFKEWYFPYLKPWEHYVPVNRNLSDLVENLKIIKNDANLEEKIRINAFTFAETHLTRESALSRWAYLLTRCNATI